MRIRFGVAAIFLSLAVVASLAQAQLPSLLPAKPATQAAPASKVEINDPKQDLAAAETRLNDAQDAVKRLQAQLNKGNLSVGVRQELLQQFNLRQTLADRYAEQVDYLKRITVVTQKIEDAKQQRDNWTPPAGSPPWSVLDGDAVRNEMLVLESRIAQLGKEIASVSNQLVGLGQEKAVVETKVRQLQGGAAKASELKNKALDTIVELANKLVL